MNIPGVGPAFAKRLERLGIKTDRDLLYHLPSRYDDYSLITKVKDIQEGEIVTVRGKIIKIENIFTRGGYVLQKAVVEDETGKLPVVWFNQRFLTRVIYPNCDISLSGKIMKHQLESPQYEIVASQQHLQDHPLQMASIHTGRLIPIYPETQGISSKWLRTKIHFLLSNKFEDYLPQSDLMSLDEALHQVHFPDSLEKAQKAKYRLAFDELLFSQLLAIERKVENEISKVGHKFKTVKVKLDLPFELTKSQRRVIDEIFNDLAKDKPMNRLLQGDVGSGKTIVAAFALLAANQNGYQTVLMAPTEILANQHYETLKKLGLKVGLVTGSNKINDSGRGQNDILVGTHALLNDNLNFEKLGLVVIDEQHRFGVEQRAKLLSKGVNPHVLTMTATPIPRTIALTLYKDLDLSIIDEMPQNRLKIKTWVVPEEKRESAYSWIEKQNTQTFVVCPVIEENEDIKAATSEFEKLKKRFPNQKIGLLHGRIKYKDKIINDFKNGKSDILVTTSVIEVGIDIPSATIMIIEDADRFGLAQLHQLRGRVGRGDKQSYCLLFGENVARLKLLEKLDNGLALAEADLVYRGPGQRFGVSQHGKWDLKIADFSDFELIEKAQKLANEAVSDWNKFPALHKIIEKSKIRVHDTLT